jgi:hypothetical protein
MKNKLISRNTKIESLYIIPFFCSSYVVFDVYLQQNKSKIPRWQVQKFEIQHT